MTSLVMVSWNNTEVVSHYLPVWGGPGVRWSVKAPLGSCMVGVSQSTSQATPSAENSTTLNEKREVNHWQLRSDLDSNYPLVGTSIIFYCGVSKAHNEFRVRSLLKAYTRKTPRRRWALNLCYIDWKSGFDQLSYPRLRCHKKNTKLSITLANESQKELMIKTSITGPGFSTNDGETRFRNTICANNKM